MAIIQNKIKLFVGLIDEPFSRPTMAIEIGDGLYQVEPTSDYDPEDEIWEFPPGSIVKVIKKRYEGKSYLLAVKPE